MRLDILVQRLGERVIDVNKIFSAAIGNVESFASRFVRRKAGLEIGFDDIFNIGKIAALSAVTVDRGRFVFHEKQDKLRNDSRICRRSGPGGGRIR